jgi:hypothetical protein
MHITSNKGKRQKTARKEQNSGRKASVHHGDYAQGIENDATKPTPEIIHPSICPYQVG